MKEEMKKKILKFLVADIRDLHGKKRYLFILFIFLISIVHAQFFYHLPLYLRQYTLRDSFFYFIVIIIIYISIWLAFILIVKKKAKELDLVSVNVSDNKTLRSGKG